MRKYHEGEMGPWRRWRVERSIERTFGARARWGTHHLSDLSLSYYVAFLEAGHDTTDAFVLARQSAILGDDATNYPEHERPRLRPFTD